jgi:hypothetical protein
MKAVNTKLSENKTMFRLTAENTQKAVERMQTIKTESKIRAGSPIRRWKSKSLEISSGNLGGNEKRGALKRLSFVENVGADYKI